MKDTMLIFLTRSFIFFRLSDHEFGEIPVADILRSALRKEVDVILVVLELVLFLKLIFLLLLSLRNAELFEVPIAPFVRVDVFIVFFNPSESLLFSHFDFFIVVFLH